MQTQIFMVHKRHLGLRAPTVLAVGFALTILVGALVLNTDQCTAVLTVTSPVTQLAEAAVNSASRNGVICPSDTARAVRHVHHRRDGSGSAVLPVRAALRFPEGNHNGRVPRGFGILQRRL